MLNNLESEIGYLKTKGDVTYTICDVRSEKAKKIQAKIVDAIDNKQDWKLYRKLLDRFYKEFKVRQFTFHNVVVTAGRAVLARLLAGDTTYSGEINYCALGNYTATATGTDTALGNELYRKLVSSKTSDSNVAYISTFFTATEVDGTFEEVGHYIDGTATKDSGQLFSRISSPNTSELPVTKSNTESLTIDYKVVLLE